MIKTAIKTLTLVGLLGGSFYLGEKIQPLEKLTTKMRYFRVEAGKDTPKDYLNWKTKVTIENDKAFLYLGNVETDVWKRVHYDGTVGNFGEQVDDFIDGKRKEVQKYLEDSKVVKELNSLGEYLGRGIYDLIH